MRIEGMVWQPDQDTVAPSGDWQRLGASRLLVQWTMVDGLAFMPVPGASTVPRLPPWAQLAGQPWAREVIVGLAGRFDEPTARRSLAELAEQS
ncbi:MAG TPA: hypothetical protein VEA40_23410, partial [Ramlibacter sp.]|nr:hypothetical protein [Ramlibacter sp.]